MLRQFSGPRHWFRTFPSNSLMQKLSRRIPKCDKQVFGFQTFHLIYLRNFIFKISVPFSADNDQYSFMLFIVFVGSRRRINDHMAKYPDDYQHRRYLCNIQKLYDYAAFMATDPGCFFLHQKNASISQNFENPQ